MNDTYQEFIFDSASFDLNKEINDECGRIQQKGIFPTAMNRGIKIYIHSGEHLPIHFHVESPQRYMNAKFSLNPLELMENKTSIRIDKDEKFIIKYFTQNKQLLANIRAKFIELNPGLNYENQ